MSKMFSKGYDDVRAEKKRQDEAKENAGKRLWKFFLADDGDEADVRFLTEEPVNFDDHTVKTVRNGKEFYDSHICTSKIGECPYCEAGERPQFKGAYLILDMREYEYTDPKTKKKKKAKGQIKLYVQGARVLSQLDRLSQKYGLVNQEYTIIRSGSGNQTTYMFESDHKKKKLTPEEIINFLPEKLREDYDGTMKSLYKILEAQLELLVSLEDVKENADDDEEEVEKYSKKNRRNLVSEDDDDDEDSDDEDEDEDDEDEDDTEDSDDEDDEDDDEPPKKSKSKLGSSKKSKPVMLNTKHSNKSVKSTLKKSKK